MRRVYSNIGISGIACKMLFAAILFCGITGHSHAQKWALKTNTLSWAVLALNIGAELGLSGKVSMELSGSYKPWTVLDKSNIRLWLVQPEVRYRLCETFEGHFFGIHMHGAQYYARTGGKIYDGYLAGGGVTYGHAWILSPRWNLEAVIGVGYARLWYKKRPDLPCAKCSVDKTRNYFGPTKISLSVSYLF